MNRRDVFLGGAGLGLTLLSGRDAAAHIAQQFDPVGPIVPVRALPDRIFRVTVCLRPFRAVGPRIETEQVGRKLVVHNYGHGGSGWSLSWGSAQVAVRKALEAGGRDIAVIGAGALGLTAAITAQRAGATVTIYARERFPDVRSARATGAWSPASAIAMADAAAPGFGEDWERMARASFAMHQGFLGLPGNPVEWIDRYTLSDVPFDQLQRLNAAKEKAGFARLYDRIHDLSPSPQPLPPGSHPFATRFAARNSGMIFNITDLSHQLTADFLAAGGRFEFAEFHAPSDLGRLRQKTIINCTGYGARALWKDESIVPIRGQIAWLIPQAVVPHSITFGQIGMIARRDGIVVQDYGPDDLSGFGDANETPDRAAADASIGQLARFYAGF